MSAHLGIPNLTDLGDDIWTGGQPSTEHLRALGEAGFKSVISLCPALECGWDEQAVAQALGLRYECISISAGRDLTAEAAHRLHDILETFPRPLLVHCGSANRVGALFVLRAHFVQGHDAITALDQGRQAGLTSLEATVRQILSQ